MPARKPLVIVSGVSPARIEQLQAGDTVDGAASGLVETAGPTTLPMGAVVDGTFLMRSGGSVVGSVPSGNLIAPQTSQGWSQPDSQRNTAIINTSLAVVANQFGNGGVTVFQDVTGLYTNYNSSAGAPPQDAGIGQNPTVSQRGSGPIFTARFRTGPTPTDIQNCRIWVGLFSQTSPQAADDPAMHLAAIRYNPAVDLAGWAACTKDGVTLNASLGAATIAQDTYYVLQIDMSDLSQVVFRLNGVTIATHVANLPGLTTPMGAWCIVRSLLAGVRIIRWGRFHFTNP